jgi:hypothetical protein
VRRLSAGNDVGTRTEVCPLMGTVVEQRLVKTVYNSLRQRGYID